MRRDTRCFCTHFTCVTSTKVQILTPEELLEALLHLGANPNIRTGLAGCPRGAQPGMGWTPLFRAGTQFTCFTSTPVQILAALSMGWTPLFRAGTQFTCFASTPVQVLTAEGCYFSEVCIAAVEARRGAREQRVCWRMLTCADVCIHALCIAAVAAALKAGVYATN